MEFIQISVETRDERGTSTARRLRQAGLVPAVLYGLGGTTLPITISAAEVERFLRTGSHLIELKLGDKTRPAIIREVQHDPLNDSILHIDFVRVDMDVEIEDDVVLVFKGEPKGTKEGGVFIPLAQTLRVRCRPLQIPRELVIEIHDLALGDMISVDEVALPEGVVAVTPADTVLAQVAMPKLAPEPVEEEAPEGEAVEGAPVEGESEEGGDE
jgi:large subunit ribosomal protein L25